MKGISYTGVKRTMSVVWSQDWSQGFLLKTFCDPLKSYSKIRLHKRNFISTMLFGRDAKNTYNKLPMLSSFY